jgi:hypothetical protein
MTDGNISKLRKPLPWSKLLTQKNIQAEIFDKRRTPIKRCFDPHRRAPSPEHVRHPDVGGPL